MKTWKWLILAVVVILVLVCWLRSPSRDAAREPGVAPRLTEEPAPAGPELPAAPEAGPEPDGLLEEPEADLSADEGAIQEASDISILLPMVELRPDMVLASVNDIHLSLPDLMALDPAAETERALRADAYAELLNRAIDRELTFQAAQAQGIDLHPTQEEELEEIRANALARAGAPYMPADYNPEIQADFEVRDRRAQLLQNTLLGMPGRPADYISAEQVRDYFAAHRDEFPGLATDPPEDDPDWISAAAEIRNRLASELFIQHEKNRRELLEQLRQEASIEVRVATGEE